MPATRYEVALYHNGQRIDVLGFTARRTKRALLDFARENSNAILPLLSDEDLDREYQWNAAAGRISFGPAAVAFTGYTERDRIVENLARLQAAERREGVQA